MLTVEVVSENEFLVEYTDATGAVARQDYFGALDVGTWGVQLDGTAYWTDGPVPRSEQAVLAFENGTYYLSPQPS